MPRTPRRGRRLSGRKAWIFVGFLALVGINLYVFVFGRASLVKVRKQALLAVRHRGASRRVAKFLEARKSPVDLRPSGLFGRGDGGEGDPLEEEARTLVGQLRRGDSLHMAFGRLGLSRRLADRVAGALRGLYDFRSARPGQTFTIKVSGDGTKILEFEFAASKRRFFLVRRIGDRLVGEAKEKPVERRVFVLGFRVSAPLYAMVDKVRERPRLVAMIVRALSWEVNFYTDVHKGDRIRLVVEKEFLDGRFYRYGRLLAVRFTGKKGQHEAFYYQDRKGRTGYFDRQGRALRRNLLKTPLKYARISSRFDRRRFHPILHQYKEHLGVDFAAPTGTPVWAAADGVVEFAGRNRAAGNMVVLRHEGGLVTVYMHLLRFARGIRKGQEVRQRQVIGYVGATGRATGPHLHFGLKVKGVYVDPLKYPAVRAPGVPKKESGVFRKLVAALVAEMDSLPVTDEPRPARPAGKALGAALRLLLTHRAGK